MTRFYFSAVVMMACGGTTTDTTDASDTSTPPISTDLTDVNCALNANVPTALNCTWTSAAGGEGWIETWLDGDTPSPTPRGPSGTSHEVSAIGLRAGQTWNFRVITTTPDGDLVGPDQSVVTPAPPSYLPVNTVSNVEAGSLAADGYVLSAMINWQDSIPVIVNGEGQYVWWFEPPSGSLIVTTKLSRDGKSVLFATYDIDWQQDVGTIWRVSLDGKTVTETRALLAHHDFLENDDGTFTFFGYEYRDFGQTSWASDVLRRVPEGTTNADDAVVEFSWFDSYPVEPWVADPLQDNVSLGNADYEWTHSNSLMVNGDGHTYLMSKFLDVILKVDADGNIVWEMGGAYSDFTNPDGSEVWTSLSDHDLWSHAHMSHFWTDGFAVFDNGYYRNDGSERSRAVEYTFDESTLQVEEVWSYEEPNDGFTKLMGDVRKLDDTYLINWSSLSYVSEVDALGEIVWMLDLDDTDGSGNKAIMSRITYLDDLYSPTPR